MKKIIGYLRASTNEKKQDVSHQRESILKYAKSNGLVVDGFVQEYISAYKTSTNEREGIMQVLDMAKKGELDAIIIFESSRLSRRFTDNINIIEEFTACNVKIHSVKDNGIINQQDIDRLFNAFRGYMNESFSKDCSVRIKSAKALNRKEGLWLGGKLQFGFLVTDDKKLVPDESKIDIIKELYNIYFAKDNRSCIEYLSQFTDKYKTNQTMIYYMSNPIMEKIVGKDVLYKYNKIRKERANHGNTMTNRSKVRYESLLYCRCGNKLTIDRNRGNIIFRCRKCKPIKNIGYKKSFSGNKLMDNIDIEVNQLLDKLDREKLKERHYKDLHKRLDLLKSERDSLNKLLKDRNKELKMAQDKLQKLILVDVPVETLNIVADMINNSKDEISKLEYDIGNINQEIEIENINASKDDKLIKRLLDIKYLYSRADNQQKKIILREIIDKVVVYDVDDFKIYANF